MFRFLILLLLLPLTLAYADQNIPTKIILDKIPEKVYGTLTINGMLVREDSKGIAYASVIARIESSKGDVKYLTDVTDSSGRFAMTWVTGKEEGSFKVSVRYSGNSYYAPSNNEFTVTVEYVKLYVNTDKILYSRGEELILYGRGNPGDTLSVFVASDTRSLLKYIIVGSDSNFNATILRWDDSYPAGIYTIQVSSTTDLNSYEKLEVNLKKEEKEVPKISTTLSMDPPPSIIAYNDIIHLKGELEDVQSAKIQFMLMYNKIERLIAETLTDKKGRFYADISARDLEPLLNASAPVKFSLFARFNGNDNLTASESKSYESIFKPRMLTLTLNKLEFVPNDTLILSGEGPVREWLDIILLDPANNIVAEKRILTEGYYEDKLIYWSKVSENLPEGNYTLKVRTVDSPVLEIQQIIRFEEPKPLAAYNLNVYVYYNNLTLNGAKVKLASNYGEIFAARDQGKYVFNNLYKIKRELGDTLSITIELENEDLNFRIIDANTRKVVSKTVSGIKLNDTLADALVSIILSEKHEVAAANIFEMQSKIARYYRDAIDLDSKGIDIEIFSDKVSKGKYVNDKIPKISIAKSVSSPRYPYTFDILAHEYTHYMQDLYGSIYHYNEMNHGGFYNPTTADSMVEGFANFMAGVISEYYNGQARFLKYDLEHNSVISNLFMSEEIAVAGIFWDLYDVSDDESISIDIKDIWDIMREKHYFPAYNNSVRAGERYIYYIKDLHYILTLNYDVENVFKLHGVINGYTDPSRPDRV